HALATGVVGGMITATVLAIFFVPLFFVVVMSLGKKRVPAAPDEQAAQGAQS
ncbi:efflux RND transporter permease subunit, partial [Pusillimonas sp.]|uniref:efflux RND transporter permease subunit n=1 Tax=Pusillimonas sp. TaxID=3040095 RepID=UPI0039C99155